MSKPYCCHIYADDRACLQPATWHIRWSVGLVPETDSCDAHIAVLVKGVAAQTFTLTRIKPEPTTEVLVADWINNHFRAFEVDWDTKLAEQFLTKLDLIKRPDIPDTLVAVCQGKAQPPPFTDLAREQIADLIVALAEGDT